jgi:hypothetical protein
VQLYAIISFSEVCELIEYEPYALYYGIPLKLELESLKHLLGIDYSWLLFLYSIEYWRVLKKFESVVHHR